MSDPETTATTAEAPAVELSAKERRALREKARREFHAAQRAELEAKAGGKAKATTEPAKAPEPERTDEHRAEDAAAFLSGVVWPIVGLLWRLFGWQLDKLTATEAAEAGHGFVVFLRRWRALDLVTQWAGAPARLARLIATKTKRREPAQPDGQGGTVHELQTRRQEHSP